MMTLQELIDDIKECGSSEMIFEKSHRSYHFDPQGYENGVETWSVQETNLPDDEDNRYTFYSSLEEAMSDYRVWNGMTIGEAYEKLIMTGIERI